MSSPVIASFGDKNRIFLTLVALSVAVSIFYIFNRIIINRINSLNLAFLALPILYLTSMSILTAIGRYGFGAREALASRYASVTLTLWIFIIAGVFHFLKDGKFLSIRNYFVLGCVYLIILIPFQLDALKKSNSSFEKRLTAVGLNLGFIDRDQISRLFPNQDYVLGKTDFVIENNLGIFGSRAFQEGRRDFGEKGFVSELSNCLGGLETHFNLETPGAVKVFGWSYLPQQGVSLGDFLVLNDSSKIIGQGVSGAFRPDVSMALGIGEKQTGLAFYASGKTLEYTLVNIYDHFACTFRAPKND